MNRINVFRVLSIVVAIQLAVQFAPVQLELSSAYSQLVDEIGSKWRGSDFEFESSWKTVTDSKAVEAFGLKFEKAFGEEDVNAVAAMMSFDAMADKAVKGLANTGYKKAIRRDISQLEVPFSTKLVLGSIKFVRVKDSEYGPAVLMRFLDKDENLNFHEWRLMRSPQGQIKAVDLYVYASGESLSDTYRRLAVVNLPTDDRGVLGKLTGAEPSFIKDQKKLNAFMDAKSKGDWAAAMKAFDALPKKLTDVKVTRVLHLQVAAKFGDEEYLKALEEFKTRFPNDASQNLVSIDLHFMKKDYTALIASIDGLMTHVGRDAQLLYLRGTGNWMAGNFKEAEADADEAIKIEPDFENGYWGKLNSTVRLGEFDATNKAIKKLVEFGYVEFDFSDEAFAAYRDSPQYKQIQEFLKNLK